MSPQTARPHRSTRHAQTVCPRHDEPVADQGFACHRCADELRAALEAVAPTVRRLPDPVRVWVPPKNEDEEGRWVFAVGSFGRGRTTAWDTRAGRTGGLVGDLVLTLTRQGVTGASGSSGEQPVPWDERAARAATAVASALGAAFRLVEVRGWYGPDEVPLGITALRLLDHVDWLRHQHEGPVLIEGIVSAVREAQHVVDVQPDRLMCGPCNTPAVDADGREYVCEAELRAVVGRDVVRCPSCGAEHDVAYRRRYLLDAVREELANASTLAAAVTRLGQQVTADRIRQWASRDRIEARGHDSRRRPLYRVGDVLDLLDEQAARSTATTQEEE